ncbi:hypothetical protein BDP27DRAFT_1431658 [Rhodocollybia butyracea]|uniref:Uncharacterized protein n=1 Tax=Rhodocollybia butyracea TaxID=206335 RepID=A0A9P5P8E0_9AGAR|nr:hypothetical protein BDP27DRAFT_1431658 [Rhodocollybia butyracea]
MKDRVEDPSQRGEGAEKTKKPHKQGKKVKDHDRPPPAPLLSAHIQQTPLRILLPAHISIPAPPATLPLSGPIPLSLCILSIPTGMKHSAPLEKHNCCLCASEDDLCDDLKWVEGSFEALQSSHEEILCCNNHIVETSCWVQWGKEVVESQLHDARYEMKLLGNMLKSSAGFSNDSLVQRLQSDQELLALEYVLMLHQLDLPGFINCDSTVAELPLFVEAHSALSNTVPSITNEACQSQLALRMVLEDFNLQYPHICHLLQCSTSGWTEQTLARNAGFETVISAIKLIFNQDCTIQYGCHLQFTSDLFLLQNLCNAQGSSLWEAIRGLLNGLDIVADSPSSPTVPRTISSSVSYLLLTNPSSSPAVPVVPVTLMARISVGVQRSPNVVVNVPLPPEDMEDLEYMSNGEIFGRQNEEEIEVDELKDEDSSAEVAVTEGVVPPGIVNLDVSVVMEDGMDTAVDAVGSMGGNAPVPSPSSFLPDPKYPLFLPSSEPSLTGSAML